MNKRALSQVNGFGALIAIVLVVICGLRYLTGAGAFIFGAISWPSPSGRYPEYGTPCLDHSGGFAS